MLAERLGAPAVGARPARLPDRALGRQGPAASRQGRGDPAADADRPRRHRRRLPAPARRRRSAPCASSASAPGTRSTRRWRPASRTDADEILALDEGGSAWEEALALRAAAAADARGRRRSIARSRRWATSPTWSRRTSPGHSAGVAELAAAAARALPDRRGRRDGDPPRGARPRPRARRGPRADLAEARAADARTSGSRCGCTRTTPSASSRARRSSRRSRRSPAPTTSASTAPATTAAPPAPTLAAAGPPARRRRRLPRDDRAAAAPRAALARAGRGGARRGGERRTARPRRRRGSARGGRPARRRALERPAGLTEREAEVVGPARPRPADQAGRPSARDLGQDRRPPHPERLRARSASRPAPPRRCSRWSTGSWHGENSRLRGRGPVVASSASR